MPDYSDTALIMIDMQNSYLATDGWRERLGYPPIWRLEETIAECDALMQRCREMGIPIIYTKGLRREDGADIAPRYREAFEKAADGWTFDPEFEDWKGEIMDRLAPHSQDIVLSKPRWCSFQYTELEPILRNLGVQRLIVAGLQTNVCVETTVRSALMRNFLVAVPENAVSTDGEDLHWHGLQSMKILYAEVAPWRDLLDGTPWTRATDDINYGRTETVGSSA